MKNVWKLLAGWVATAVAYVWASSLAAGDVTADLNITGWHSMEGQTIVFGTVTLDGSNPTPVDLAAYMTSVTWGMVNFEATAAPGLDPSLVTHALSAAVLNVYAWKVTGAGDTTLVASTNNTDEVAFIAIGPALDA